MTGAVAPAVFSRSHQRTDAAGVEKAGEAAEKLRKNRRPGRARHAQRNDRNQQQVERDVEKARDDQENERHGGVPQRAQRGGNPVVQHRADCADVDHAQIIARRGENVGRRFQKAQQRVGCRKPRERQHQRGNERHIHRRDERRAHAFFVARAEILRQHHACAGRYAQNERGEHIRRDARGADG